MNHDTVTAITHLPAADIVTYRLNGKLVYVTPTTKYDVRLLWMSFMLPQLIMTHANQQQAVAQAYSTFPEELSTVQKEQVALAITCLVQGEHRVVQIAPSAWTSVLPTLTRFEIIDVIVKEDKPPRYDAKENPDTEIHSIYSSRSRFPLLLRWCQELLGCCKSTR
jgi:hypothetical protein